MSENKFSDRLSEAIRRSGKTQSEIAKSVGITAPYLSDLKKGHKGNPSQAILRKLAETLGTTPAWLMIGEAPTSLHESRPVYRISPGQAARLAADLEKHRSLADLSEARRGEIQNLVGQRLLELSESGPAQTESILSEISDAVRSYSRWISAVREDTASRSSPAPGQAPAKTA